LKISPSLEKDANSSGDKVITSAANDVSNLHYFAALYDAIN